MFKAFIKWMILFLCFSAFSWADTPGSPFSERTEVLTFIKEMENKHRLNAGELISWFKQYSSDPKVISAISRPYEKQPWYRYQQKLITQERIQSGIQFSKDNYSALKKAESKYGIPSEIIVAIIGVETSYGQKKGSFPVLQSLATLAFDYPPRSKFFRKELEEFLLLVKEHQLNPVKMLGSYAGAIGTPQFMPSSYRKYAVSATGRHSDLINNLDDAIESVAYYFKAHGWQKGEPIAFVADIQSIKDKALLSSADPKNPKPSLLLKQLAESGVYPKEQDALKNKDAKAALITLESSSSLEEHWLGLQNFYVITRYNPSTLYAMAVFQLSEHIRRQQN